jgi:TATA-box binding protein (TBP) (component of TFIID and TFIIIB)
MIISKPCVTMRGIVIGGYSWEKPIKIDLRKTAQCLEGRGYNVKKLLQGMMLIVEMEGYEVSVYPSGKIIVKLLDDAELGREMAEIIYDCAGVLEVVS